MSTYKAKEFFDDAKVHLDADRDPVMWDLMNGLSELCDAVQYLTNRVAEMRREQR